MEILRHEKSNPNNIQISDTISFSNKYLNEQDWDNITRSNNQNIHTINLSGINIDKIGLKALGLIIKQCLNLKTLILEWNYLNEYSDDFDNFCEFLSLTEVISLHLNNNKINSLNCNSICKVIKKCQGLLSLDLRWNEIDDEGAKIILKSMENNNRIKEINLIGNKVGEGVQREINECIRRNKITNKFINEKEIDYALTPEKDYPNAISLKLLGKEKEISDEFRARYDVQLIANAKLEKRNKELEVMIQLERKKVIEAKEIFDEEIQSGKNIRLKLEEQILYLKEENMKSKIEIKKIENECENKLISVNHHLLNLQRENKSMKENFDKMNNSSENKCNLMKEEHEKILNNLYSTIDDLKKQYSDDKRNYMQEMKQNYQELENHFKATKENFINLQNEKYEIENVILELKKEVLESKIENERKIKDKEIIFMKVQTQKHETFESFYEKKTRMLEMSIEELKDRNDKLHKETVDLKKISTSEYMKYDNKINEMVLENNSLNNTIVILNCEINKISTDLLAKSALLKDDNSILLLLKLENQVIDHKRCIEEINEKYTDNISKKEKEKLFLQKSIEIEKRNFSIKIEEQEKMVMGLKERLTKLEAEDHLRFEKMKTSIFQLIDSNCSSN